METLSNRLERARLDLHLSQRKTARMVQKAGYTGTANGGSIGKYEKGINVPGVEYVRAFCEALDVNPGWLLSGIGRRMWGKDDEARHGRLQAAAWMEDCAAWLRSSAQHKPGEIRHDHIGPAELVEAVVSPQRGLRVEDERSQQMGQ